MILVVTKDTDISEKLEKIGYKTICADSHENVLKIFGDKKIINLIIIDIDTVNEIKLIVKNILLKWDIPLIYVTDNVERELSKELEGIVYHGYLSKKSNEFIFRHSIETALNMFKHNEEFNKMYKYIYKDELLSGFGYWVFDLENNIVRASEGAKRIYGIQNEYISIDEFNKCSLPEYRKFLDTAMKNLIEKKSSYNLEFKIKNNGRIISIHSIAQYDHEKKLVMGTLYDISKQKKSEEVAKEKKQEYAEIFNEHHAVMFIIDPDTGGIIISNRSASKFYGWSQKKLNKMKITEINIMDKKEVHADIELARSQEKKFFSCKHRLADGSIRDVEVYCGPIKIDGKMRLFSIITDVTDRKKAEERIQTLAYHDTLTNLPNRKMFLDHLEKSICNGNRNNSKVALLNIDLDHFKEVNDSLGHNIGDILLNKVADRFRNNIRKNNTVFRLGGDEFAIIMDSFSDQQEISHLLERILKFLRIPFQIGNKEIFISTSIGVSIYPDDATNKNILLKNSDLAMYKAKNNGKNGYYFFCEEINNIVKNKVEIEANLRNAFKKGEIILYYQPKIDISENKIIGTESLIRWIRDGEYYKSPGEFIPIAETSGFILDIDRWVLLTACQQIEEWEKSGIKDQKISVNISGHHFKQKRIVKTVRDILERVNISPGSIEIEVTEGVFMESIEEAVSIMTEIRSLGIDISIDDFGTGYSSLSYLKNLPINRVKIDRSFIWNMTDSKKDIAITKTIITMAKLLDLNVIAEGVETPEQVEILSESGCYEMQGYYFAKPMPVKKYEAFLKEWNKK
jgi:diguanylate cyclase (GGDEF)-like protein/PAS domain S-box-containing protein